MEWTFNQAYQTIKTHPTYQCKGLGVLNRTFSVPKSVLHYVLDKGQCSNLESVFTQSYFPK